jgi:hypothetical protein
MMEEIGYRTAIYSLEGVTGSQREYMTWLIDTCSGPQSSAPGIAIIALVGPH